MSGLRRDPDKQRDWERRSRKPLKRTELKRKTPLEQQSKDADRRRRTRQKRETQMGDRGEFEGIADFIRAMPCVACLGFTNWSDTRNWLYWNGPRSEVAHIRTRGANQGVVDDDGKPNVIPLCPLEDAKGMPGRGHHDEQHRIGWKRFEERYGFQAAKVARLAMRWFKEKRGA